MNRRLFISSSLAVGGIAILTRMPSWAQRESKFQIPDSKGIENPKAKQIQKSKGIKKVTKTDAEWRAQLTPEQYNVLREKGTEYAGTSPYTNLKDKGTFECAGCGLPLFSSKQKFDSGTGWPSFWAPIKKENVIEEVDRSLGITRTEVLCAQCDGHLGHVFDDGPEPTGLRYCMNGVALKFRPSDK
jgi:peptide-methionine (R)-S-oxide reductase